MFILRTLSQNFKYVTNYLQMVGRILKTNSLNIKKILLILSCLFFHKTKNY